MNISPSFLMVYFRIAEHSRWQIWWINSDKEMTRYRDFKNFTVIDLKYFRFHTRLWLVFLCKHWWFVTDFSDRLTCFSWFWDSHTPPIHGLDGGLNFHSVLHGLNFVVTKPKSTFLVLISTPFQHRPNEWHYLEKWC